MGQVMNIETVRFGSLSVDTDTVIHFPLGLLGFENLQRYVLVDTEEAAPMRWLQSVDEKALAFLVMEPGLILPSYEVPISDDDQAFLSLTAEAADGVAQGQVVVACLVAIPEDPNQMTMNLMGPLVINSQKRVGKQVVLHDSGHSARHRLLPDPAGSVESEPALV